MAPEEIDLPDEERDEWLLVQDRLAGRLPSRSPFETPLEEAGRLRRVLARPAPGLLYREPLPRGARPSLVARLERAPRTERVHPFENQVSEVLGFLVDHDPRFAADLAGLLWSPGSPPDSFWPAEADDIGAFPGGALPGAGLAPVLYPDLSICGSGGSFQIHVEVKVTADFHGYPGADGRLLLQPDAYVRGWETAAGRPPPARRRVATIAPKAPATVARHPMRGSDLLWEGDLIPLLLECAARRGPLEDHVGAVALDLATAVRARLSPPPAPGVRVPSPELEGLALEWRAPLIEALRALEERWPGVLRPGRLSSPSDYLGSFIGLDVPESDRPARVWAFITIADGRYNREGQPASACVCLWEPGPLQCPALHRRLRGHLAAAGARAADRSGETANRIYRSLSTFADAERAAQLAAWIEEILRASGLLDGQLPADGRPS